MIIFLKFKYSNFINKYIMMNKIVVIPVQYMNFFKILGFSGDPGSSPSILIGFFLSTSMGKIAKKNNPPNNYINNS